ncbi:MAG: hypothetical protein ACQEP6_02705 [Patescibacteria group bacterium]
MAYEVTQEEIDKLLKTEGEVRGVVFKTDQHFITDKGGEESVKKVEEKIKDMTGISFSYEKDSSDLNFHPIGMRTFSLLATSEVLDLDKEGIKEMGYNAPKFSMLVRFFMRYLVSPKTIMEKAGDLWKKHYTVGELEAVEISEKDRFMRCILRDLELHPIFCDYLSAYIAFIAKLGVGEEVTGEETKCTHRGDEYHEFLQKW